MVFIHLFENFNKNIEILDASPKGYIDILVNDQEITLNIVNDIIFYFSDDDEKVANSIGFELNDSMMDYILIEYKKKLNKNKMLRFGFYK